MNDQAATISHAKDTLIELAIRFGPRLFTAVLILIAGLLVSGWVTRWFTQFLGKRDLEPPLRLLLARIAGASCFAVFFLMALQNLGVELLPLIAGLGVAGAGLALATQGFTARLREESPNCIGCTSGGGSCSTRGFAASTPRISSTTTSTSLS